ncbi:hypothetical protein M436DRAFT_86031 [Aureobasidium namibiae CBS 147.97]|uniref:Uncharacterized protein n=1 Tax=Aureobasidium namibiae CBS 147.97 TaxID=1043004 RepID=A0A074WG70_9PEZI
MADERSKAETINTRKRSHAIMTGVFNTNIAHEDVSTHAPNSAPTQHTSDDQAQHTRTTRVFDRSSAIASPDNNNTEAGHSLGAPSRQIDMDPRIIESAAKFLAAVDEDQDDSMIVDENHHGLANASVSEGGDRTAAASGANHEGYDAEDEASNTSEEEGEGQMEAESDEETKAKEENDEEEETNRPMARGTSMHEDEFFEEHWDIEFHHVSSLEEVGHNDEHEAEEESDAVEMKEEEEDEEDEEQNFVDHSADLTSNIDDLYDDGYEASWIAAIRSCATGFTGEHAPALEDSDSDMDYTEDGNYDDAFICEADAGTEESLEGAIEAEEEGETNVKVEDEKEEEDADETEEEESDQEEVGEEVFSRGRWGEMLFAHVAAVSMREDGNKNEDEDEEE